MEKESLVKNKRLIQKKTGIYVMPKSRSIDIDDKFDFKVVSQIIKKDMNIKNINKFIKIIDRSPKKIKNSS